MARKISALFCIAIALLAPSLQAAFTIEEPLSNSATEAEAKAIFALVRCVVCEGQDIASSNAELAESMRLFVRKQLADGKNREEIRAILIERYGEEVWMIPHFSALTSFLWMAPLGLLIAALFYSFSQKKQDVTLK